jgi:hypothetical protein
MVSVDVKNATRSKIPFTLDVRAEKGSLLPCGQHLWRADAAPSGGKSVYIDHIKLIGSKPGCMPFPKFVITIPGREPETITFTDGVFIFPADGTDPVEAGGDC